MKKRLFAIARREKACIHGQRGQGLTEVAIAMALVLVPTFFGVVYIAKVGEAKHKVLEAARYGAWERTIWSRGSGDFNVKSDHDINREINQRIFTPGPKPLNSREDHKDVDPDSIELEPMLTTYDETTNREIALFDPIEESLNRLHTDESDIDGLGDVAIDMATELLDLDKGGLHTIDVEIDLLPERHLAMTNKLVATGRNAIFTGTWSAAGPDSVSDHVENAVPSRVLAKATEALTAVGSSVGLTDFDGLEWGYTEPDRVPCQRLMNPAGEC